MATATSTKATQNGAAATDAAFKAATDAASAATDFARNATESFVPSVEKATEQAQAYGDALFAQVKQSGLALLDAFDAGLDTVTKLEKDLVSLSEVEWVKDVTVRHAELVEHVGVAYSRAARELLK
jgi:hypothetical protein